MRVVNVGKILGNLGKSIALFIPTWLALFSPNLYALNYFALPSTYETNTAIFYGIYCIGGGIIAYFILMGLWWVLLSIFWRNYPDWISPKSWKNIFINWAIATGCLFFAFLLEPSLWRSGNVLINGAISNNQDYLIRMITSRFQTVFIPWFLTVNIAFFLKQYWSFLPSTSRGFTNNYSEMIAERDKVFGGSRKSKPRKSPYKQKTKQNTGSDDRPSRAELRLSTYLFYDEKQARRLVDGVQARYPDMPRDWCAEKALSDLERDRRIN